MEIFKKNLAFSNKLLKAHFFLLSISYGFCALIYTYLFTCKKKYFFAVFLTIQTLLLIFILQMHCLMKSSFFSAIEQIKCSLNIYAFISIIFFILVIIQYYLIFCSFKYTNIYKISLLCISMAYYISDVFIFIYEYYMIFNQIRKIISERIRMQTTQRRNIKKNINKETEPSEKSKSKKNERFEKEDTFYIIYGNFNDNNNNSLSKKINNNNTNYLVINSTTTYNKKRNKNINNNRPNKINFFENNINESKRKIRSNEGSKSHSFEKVKYFLPIFKDI